jgi:hypothetical protein
MELKNIRITYSAETTINMGNFENVKPHYGMSVDVPDGESPAEAFNEVKDFVDDLLTIETEALKATLNSRGN